MKKILFWILPFTWMGIIYYASSQPYEKQDIKPMMKVYDLSFLEPYLTWISFTYHKSEISVQNLGVESFIEFFIRKGAHFTVFFILVILFFIAFKKTTALRTSIILIVSFFLSLAYAGVDECHQGFTPNRTPYIGDVFIDGLGAFIACLCIWYIYRRDASKRSPF
ncbi:VanZ family protein [Cerasibacillus terrae]|uniref:VanZ family protein n=1 Tax=Cerasibacillus terrae TaxID=2498845 RepID=A0A5C8NV01_9BACI|nr:VanZ family protein [Cerasibacillus terrae]TXL65019.1 VanZ family protein [Cerasibacillus terrae]